MTQTETRPPVRSFWHPALPYALDYLGLVLITALVSTLWFHSRLGTLWLSVPLGIVFTLLASFIYYRWQHGRWLRRRRLLEQESLALWLADALLTGTLAGFQRLCAYLLDLQLGYRVSSDQGRMLLESKGQRYRLYCLRRHPSCPVDAQQLFQLQSAAARNGLGAAVAASCAFTPQAHEYAQEQHDLVLFSLSDLAAMAMDLGLRPPKAVRAHYNQLARRQLPRKQKSLAARIARLAALRYGVAAALMALIGFLSPWPVAYWMAAAFCAAMAVFALLPVRRRPANQSSGSPG
jgi:hypothetical protein